MTLLKQQGLQAHGFEGHVQFLLIDYSGVVDELGPEWRRDVNAGAGDPILGQSADSVALHHLKKAAPVHPGPDDAPDRAIPMVAGGPRGARRGEPEFGGGLE